MKFSHIFNLKHQRKSSVGGVIYVNEDGSFFWNGAQPVTSHLDSTPYFEHPLFELFIQGKKSNLNLIISLSCFSIKHFLPGVGWKLLLWYHTKFSRFPFNSG